MNEWLQRKNIQKRQERIDWDNMKCIPPAHRVRYTRAGAKSISTARNRLRREQSPGNDNQPYRISWFHPNCSVYQMKVVMCRHTLFTAQEGLEPIRRIRTACKQLSKIMTQIFTSVFSIVRSRQLLIPSTEQFVFTH